MLHVGIDIIEVERVAALAERFGARFKARVFSDQEWAVGLRSPASLAARFAAKEAAIKALGQRTIAYHEVEVVRAPDQPPALRLHGRAAARAGELGVSEMALSLSHSRAYAVAVVVLHAGEVPEHA